MAAILSRPRCINSTYMHTCVYINTYEPITYFLFILCMHSSQIIIIVIVIVLVIVIVIVIVIIIMYKS